MTPPETDAIIIREHAVLRQAIVELDKMRYAKRDWLLLEDVLALLHQVEKDKPQKSAVIRIRRDNVHSPMKCCKCGVVLDRGDEYLSTSGGYEQCMPCYEALTTNQ